MSAVLTPELLRKADSFLDTDEQHQAATQLGAFLFDTFGADKGQISTQVRNLQQMAVSATRFADIEDFVKNQMGKKTGAYEKWRKVGDKVLTQIHQLRDAADKIALDEVKCLRDEADKFASSTADVRTETKVKRLREEADRLATDQGQRLVLRLHLARGWVRAVVGAYLYAKAQKEMEQSHA